MAEPEDFESAPGIVATPKTTTPIDWGYSFGDLPAGTKLEITLTVPGKPAKVKNVSVPANKTAKNCTIVLSGFVTNGI